MSARGSVLLYCLGIILLFPLDSAAQRVCVGGPGGCPVFSLGATRTNVFAGTDRGVFVSKDSGASWRPAGPALPEDAQGAAGRAEGQLIFSRQPARPFLNWRYNRSTPGPDFNKRHVDSGSKGRGFKSLRIVPRAFYRR
jgi:hypothetical protein